MCFVTDLCYTVICIIANEQNKTERLIFWQVTPNSNYSVFLTSVRSKQKMKLDSLLYSKCSRFSQCFHSTKETLKSFPFWFQSWPLNRLGVFDNPLKKMPKTVWLYYVYTTRLRLCHSVGGSPEFHLYRLGNQQCWNSEGCYKHNSLFNLSNIKHNQGVKE